MKKYLRLSALALSVIFFTLSCEKENLSERQGTEVVETVEESLENNPMAVQAQESPLTTVALSAPSFDFGVVKSGSIVEHTYELTNTGQNPLIISNVKPGCGCTVPDYTKEPILPGKTGKITLKFNSASFQGVQNKYAEVYTNTEKTPIILSFTADVQ